VLGQVCVRGTTPAALNRMLLATHFTCSFLSSRTTIGTELIFITATRPFVQLNYCTSILSRVRGSVTNNNGFWIG
jgi:hypothetical protein